MGKSTYVRQLAISRSWHPSCILVLLYSQAVGKPSTFLSPPGKEVDLIVLINAFCHHNRIIQMRYPWSYPWRLVVNFQVVQKEADCFLSSARQQYYQDWVHFKGTLAGMLFINWLGWKHVYFSVQGVLNSRFQKVIHWDNLAKGLQISILVAFIMAC